MLELKAFVQESVHALDEDALHVLCTTLRVDARGCDDRRDIERILTGLLCLDKDTSLGTFLTWLRTREAQTHTHGLLARKSAFLTTFVPTISPRKTVAETNNNPHHESAVKDHHLTDEIATQLEELKVLEQDFKDAERQVHTGSPSFEKLKAFLVKLTKLRSKEVDVRGVLIHQSERLTQQHAQMKDETLHTRAQLDFFVNGFTNLRHRHDELVEKSTQMKAENEAAQDIFLSIAAQESHFGVVLHRTTLHVLEEKRQLTQQLEHAREEIRGLKDKQQQLEQLVRRLKQERGNALKDASSYKLQLRKCKQKSEALATDSPDCVYFRQQATQLRSVLTTLLTLFRESIVRDTKTVKQSLSKEVVRAVQNVLLASPTISNKAKTPSSRPLRVVNASSVELVGELQTVARVVEKKAIAGQDIDEVVRGVVLLGGEKGEAMRCAAALCTKLRYVPVDLKIVLDQIWEETAKKNERRAAVTATGVSVGAESSFSSTPPPIVAPPPPATVENYVAPLRNAITTLQNERQAKGVVLYNCELTAREANLLIGYGIPMDSIIDLSVRPPPPPPTISTQPLPSTPSSKAKTTTASKRSVSPSRGTGQAATRPASKAAPSPSSPSRPTSRQPTADTRKPTISPASLAQQTAIKLIDRKAVFVSMPDHFAQLPPVASVEARVDLILQEITRQKHLRETPWVVWDDVTNQVNEALLMYAEDINTMLWSEQDNRQPKKPSSDTTTRPTTPGSSSAKTSGNGPTRIGTSSSGTKTSGRASLSKSPSKPGSPTKPTAKPKAAAASPPKRKA